MNVRRACAVIGSPIEHSLSPALHAAAYRDLGLDWVYTRREVPSGALRGFVDDVSERGLDGLPCGGLSVTMPGKAEALARADLHDPRAAALGAANTLIPSYDGERLTGWSAYNTDVDGIIGALADHDVASTAAGVAVVLGAGGTAAAAIAALGALGSSRIDVVARNHDKAAGLVALGEQLDVEVVLVPWTTLRTAAEDADVLISTLPPGVADDAADVPFTARQIVLDAVYAGGATPLLRAAHAGGARAVSGLAMLLHQAARQVVLMTGQAPSIDVMRAALQ